MLVQARDGLFYGNFHINLDNCYIAVNGIEEPKIVVRYSKTSNLKSSRRLAVQKLKKAGIKAKIIGNGEENKFAFPPDWEGLNPGSEWGLRFEEEIPIPDHHEYVTQFPDFSDYFLAWHMTFNRTTVADFIDDKIIDIKLVNFLLGLKIFSVEDLSKSEKNKMKNLLKQALINNPDGNKIILRKK